MKKKNHFLYTSTCQKEFNLYSTLLIWFDLMHMTTLSNISYTVKIIWQWIWNADLNTLQQSDLVKQSV